VVQLSPLIHDAKRTAEKLSRYCIMPAHHGVVLWLFKDQWTIVQPYGDRAAAEAALFALLEPICDTRGDLIRI
jgi:hypothetical protein